MVLDCIFPDLFYYAIRSMLVSSLQSNAPYMDKASSKINMLPIAPKRDNNYCLTKICRM